MFQGYGLRAVGNLHRHYRLSPLRSPPLLLTSPKASAVHAMLDSLSAHHWSTAAPNHSNLMRVNEDAMRNGVALYAGMALVG